METENNIPLLPPPTEEAEETVEITWDDGIPEKKEDFGPATEPETDRTPEEIHSHEPATQGNPFRFLLKAGLILLGAFAAVLFAVSAINGAGTLLGTGLLRISLGELFGGTENIVVLPLSTENPLAKETASPSDTQSSPLSAENTAETTGENPHETSPAESLPITEPSGLVSIVSADLSAFGEHGLSLINETPYEPILTPDSDRAIPCLSELYAEYGADAPVVLILHTHATESFADDGATSTSEEEYRSLEASENMLAVGKALAEVLTARGINTIHCEEMFDRTDFTMAYYNASLKIRTILEEYPSVSYILDLHRDSIAYGNGEETIRPVTVIDGQSFAQIMFVVGTDHGGSGHTEWDDNLNLALRLQSRIHEEYPGLMRSVNLRSASFNQQYTKGSLLIEMGAVGSSIEEACRSAELFGKFLADEIIGEEPAVSLPVQEERVPLMHRTSSDPLPKDWAA